MVFGKRLVQITGYSFICILILKKSLEEHFELKSRFFLSETQKAIALKTPPVDKSIVENAVAARGG